MKKISIIFIILFSACNFGENNFGEFIENAINYYSFTGTVLFNNNIPIEDIRIEIINLDSKIAGTTETNSTGNYSYIYVQPEQNYVIKPTGIGYIYEPSSYEVNTEDISLSYDYNASLKQHFIHLYGESSLEIARDVIVDNDHIVVIGETSSFRETPQSNKDIWVIMLNSNGTIAKEMRYGGENDDYGYSIKKTPDGGYILAGATLSAGAGNYDIIILKINSQFNMEWVKIYGTDKIEIARQVEVITDSSGNINGYLVLGYVHPASGNRDFLLLHIDEMGNKLYEKKYGGIDFDDAYALKQLKNISGESLGFIIAGITSSWGAGNNDLWVVKLKNDFTIEWQKTYGGTGDDYAYDVKINQDNNIVVVGYSSSFDLVSGEIDAWILKLDSTGNVLKQFSLNGSDNDYLDIFRSCIITESGDIIVAGYTNSFVADMGSDINNTNIFLMRFSLNSGNVEWQRTFLSNAKEYAYKLQQAGNSFIMIGQSNDNVVNRKEDFFVIKTNDEGNFNANETEINILTNKFTVTPTTVSGLSSFASTMEFTTIISSIILNVNETKCVANHK